MAPLAVVKNLNVFLDRCLGMGTRFIMLVMCQFIFQAAPEASIGALSKQFPLRDMDACMPNWSSNLR